MQNLKPKKSLFISLRVMLGISVAVITIAGGSIQLFEKWNTPRHQMTQNALAQANYEKARQSFNEGKLDASISETSAALRITPNNKEVRKLLAASFGLKNNMEACASEYRNALRIDRHDDEALMGLATALEALGDKVGAKDAYERVANDADAAPSHRDRARVQLAKL